MVPRDSETRNAISDALAERLSRPVGHNEVGFGKDLVGSGCVRPCPVVTGSSCPMCAHGSAVVECLRDAVAGGLLAAVEALRVDPE
jgi:hypothetical protein